MAVSNPRAPVTPPQSACRPCRSVRPNAAVQAAETAAAPLLRLPCNGLLGPTTLDDLICPHED